MGVRKDTVRNKWVAEVYIGNKRLRKWFDNKGEANRYYAALKEKNSPLFQAVQLSKEAVPRLSDLARLWFDLYGQSLRDGVGRLRKLELMISALGDPLASQFSAEDFAEYRAKRLRGEIHFKKKNSQDGIKARTLNFELDILQAMFNELKRLKKWKGENPLSILRPLPTQELELRFLREDEITRLLDCCAQISDDLKMAVLVCLATGARWGEVMKLTASNVIPYKVIFTNTKGGKNRAVPISPELYKQLNLSRQYLFRGVNDNQFRKAVDLADIQLRENQLTHVLRHTFASHFMMNGGNILVLKDVLGHADISMTMVYAHFSPNHLDQAVQFNPINNFDLSA